VAGCDSSHHQRCLLQGLEGLVARSPKSFAAPLVQQILAAVEPLRAALSAARPRARVPYVPQWTASTDSTSFIASAVVQIVSAKEFCHATGTPLPSAGNVSFSVVVNSRAGEIRPLATLGQFYIGVTTAKVAALSNIASWKSAEAAPSVWALHSVAHSQLHHCNAAGFGHDPFLFACAMPVTVEIDRDLGTMTVRRPGSVYANVFDGIPKGAALTPFVQIIGEKTAAGRRAARRRLPPLSSGASTCRPRTRPLRCGCLAPSATRGTPSPATAKRAAPWWCSASARLAWRR
jgi:hypothetical protein